MVPLSKSWKDLKKIKSVLISINLQLFDATLIVARRCKIVKWPPVSGGWRPFRSAQNGRWPFRPRLKCLIIKLGLNGPWPFGAGLNGHWPPETVGHLDPIQRVNFRLLYHHSTYDNSLCSVSRALCWMRFPGWIQLVDILKAMPSCSYQVITQILQFWKCKCKEIGAPIIWPKWCNDP